MPKTREGVLNMAIPITSATHAQAQPAVKVTQARQPAPQPRPQPPVTDTVQISAAAKALQETIETAAQTAREASTGDVQAQRLLARQAAAHASEK